MIDEKLFQMLISFVVAPLVTFAGKVVFDRLKSNEQAVKELQKEIEQKYQNKELAHHQNSELKSQLDRVLDKLDSIETKLDKKADK